MRCYGMPYMGSKNSIAKDIIEFLPQADTLVDIFAGGCAITHAALLSDKYNHVVSNDILGTATLFEQIVKGQKEISYEWVSREDFHKRKDTDLITSICWSFGNDGKSYIYGKDKEPWKRKAHEWVIAEGKSQVKERYKHYKKFMRENSGKRFELENLERLQRIESVERLQGLEKLEGRTDIIQSIDSLERLKGLEGIGIIQAMENDYRDVPVPENSIIYCDPPYKGTSSYRGAPFDYEAFYDWCEKQTVPVFISEYDMPDDRFVCVWEKQKTVLRCATDNTTKKVEKIYRPKCQLH